MIIIITFIVMLKMMMDGLAIILIIVLQRVGLSFEKRIFDGLYLHLCSHAIISSILTFRIKREPLGIMINGGSSIGNSENVELEKLFLRSD